MTDDLRYRIGGDTSGIDAAWGKIKRDAAATAGVINTAMGRARSGVETFMAPLRAVPALFAAIGTTAVLGAVRQTAEAVADVGREAKRAGVDVEAFQELKFVAEQNRIGVDALTDGLKELNLRADEFIATGKGPAAEAFGRLGFSSEELAEKLKDPSALFTEIIGKLQRFDEAARIRIADEIFGGSAGERFVELVNLGEQGIRAQIDAARELGLVMDSDMIAKAEEVDRKFQVISSTIGTAVKGAIVDAVSAWFTFLDSFREFEQQQTRTLETRVTANDQERLDIERQILDLRQQQRELTDNARDLGFGDKINADIAALEARLRAISAENDRVETILSGRENSAPPAGPLETIDTSAEFIRRYREELALSNHERKVAAETQRILNEASGEGARLTEEQARKLAEEKVARDEAEASRKASAGSADKEADAVRRVIAELEHELSLLGMSDTERRIANELRAAGAAATQRERDRIAALVSQIEAENAALERNRQATEARAQALDNLFQMGNDALMSLIDNSLKGEDALKRLALQLALAAAQAALLGTGPLAGLFGGGGLFGGSADPWDGLRTVTGFDLGGYTGNIGRRKIAGVVHGEEFVMNADATARNRPILEAMNAGRDIGLFSAGRTMAEVGERAAAGANSQATVRLIMPEGWRAEIVDEAVQGSREEAVRLIQDYDHAVLPQRVNAIAADPRAR